ncbi:hypothetical protein [Abyssisolibacter fermentans]|uniref:hypothetical protein n=1 Tax=Abyssisolibacter fermentans TaxID=1766203 RepID=UPI000834A1FC|nr:hypothetical protein [Abyssisolibacter fermentans]
MLLIVKLFAWKEIRYEKKVIITIIIILISCIAMGKYINQKNKIEMYKSRTLENYGILLNNSLNDFKYNYSNYDANDKIHFLTRLKSIFYVPKYSALYKQLSNEIESRSLIHLITYVNYNIRTYINHQISNPQTVNFNFDKHKEFFVNWMSLLNTYNNYNITGKKNIDLIKETYLNMKEYKEKSDDIVSSFTIPDKD